MLQKLKTPLPGSDTTDKVKSEIEGGAPSTDGTLKALETAIAEEKTAKAKAEERAKAEKKTISFGTSWKKASCCGGSCCGRSW